jgi:hypothetical protein
MKRSRWLVPLAAASVSAMLGVFALQRASRAQSEAPQRYAGPDIAAGGTVSASGPMERTPDAIAADEAVAPSGPAPAVALEVRPTMPMDQYVALKAAANAASPASKSVTASPSADTPVLTAVNFPGAREGVIGLNEFPSDDDADVSSTQVAQITSASLWVFDKAGTVLAQHSLNALLGTADFLGDVQVLFDSTWRRWVITADDFTLPASTFSTFWLAISTTNSATGGWIIYHFGFAGGPFVSPNFLDYPHLGMDQDALLLTGNVFNNSTGHYVDTVAFAIPKARVYNSLGFSVPVFTGLIGTLMPPVQLGKPFYGHFPADYFAAAVAGSGVWLYTMLNASTSPFLAGPVSIPSTNFSVPPSAVQPGCADNIDTLDGRFQNACYQIPPFSSFGDGLLYCVHTVGSGPFPVPVWYAFNPATNTVNSSGAFFLSPTSDDFNPAIAADGLGDIFVTETATDPGTVISPMFVKPEVLFGGALSGHPVTLDTVTPAARSSVCLTGNGGNPQRWGDYSAARFDPATSPSGTAGSVIGWITNQRVAGAKAWGTKIAKIRQ